MRARLVLVFLLALVTMSCRGDGRPLLLDALNPGRGEPFVSRSGLGETRLVPCQPIPATVGTFPATTLAFQAPASVPATLSFELINHIPGQILIIHWNFRQIYEHRFGPGETATHGDALSVTVDPGLNVVSFSYLNAEETPPRFNYILGNPRVEFTTLRIVSK
jgi:hypothetical protein